MGGAAKAVRGSHPALLTHAAYIAMGPRGRLGISTVCGREGIEADVDEHVSCEECRRIVAERGVELP